MDAALTLFIGCGIGFLLGWWQRSRDTRVDEASASKMWPPAPQSLSDLEAAGLRPLRAGEVEILGMVAVGLDGSMRYVHDIQERLNDDNLSGGSTAPPHRVVPLTPVEEALADVARSIRRAREALL